MKLPAFKKSDWFAIGSFLASGGLSGLYALFSVVVERPINPAHVINGAIGATISVGGLIRVLNSPAGAPTQFIAQNAREVPTGTTVVNAATPRIGVNVTVPTGGAGGPILTKP